MATWLGFELRPLHEMEAGDYWPLTDEVKNAPKVLASGFVHLRGWVLASCSSSCAGWMLLGPASGGMSFVSEA